MSINVDTSGLDDLAADMVMAGIKVGDEVYAVVKRGAQNIKTDWRKRARRSAGSHGRHYPRSIDYDVIRLGDRIDAEIGPNTALPQGGMGRGFEYGSVNTAPKPDGARALTAEEPKLIKHLEDIATRLLSR